MTTSTPKPTALGSEAGTPVISLRQRLPLGATLTLRQKLLLLGVMMLSMFLTALDQAIVATALPHIIADLGGFSLVSWVITMYLLTSTVIIPVIGKLSDMFGRKYFLITGILIFVASSAGCGLAPSMLTLIAARGFQGIGSGIIVACVFATLGDLFTPVERAKYFSLFVGMFTVASVAGPTLGGFLTDGPGWRWCFYINLPVGILAMTFIMLQLPAGGGKGGRITDIDIVGAGLLSVATIAFLLMIAWGGGAFGWTSPQTLGFGVVALLFTGAFIAQERRHPEAIMPPVVFQNLTFLRAILITIVASSGIFSAVQFVPTFVQISLGGSATASGLVVAPQALGILLSSLVTGQLVSRTGRFKYQMVFGASAVTLVMFLVSRLQVGAPVWMVGVLMAGLGLGSGFVFPLTQVLVQAAVSQDMQGVSAGIRQFFQQVSQAFGVAVFGLILTSAYATAFANDSHAVAPALPPEVYAQFQDPTLALDQAHFAQTSAVIRTLPNGSALFAQVLAAQRQAVATATDEIFVVSTAAGAVALLVAATLKEIRLRRSFDAEPASLVEVG